LRNQTEATAAIKQWKANKKPKPTPAKPGSATVRTVARALMSCAKQGTTGTPSPKNLTKKRKR
jgi:hypothetical protein